MKISIRYIHGDTFTGDFDSVEYSPKRNLVTLWCGSRKIELWHFKGTGDDWVHMDVMFKGNVVEFRNDDDGFTLPVDYGTTYRIGAHMRAKTYISEVLHETITEEAALGKILADMFMKEMYQTNYQE